MMTVKWPIAFIIPFTPYEHICTLNHIHMQNTCSLNKYNSKGIYLHFPEFPSMLAPSFKVGCMSKASSITLAWHQLMWNQDDEAPHKVAMYIDPGIAGKTFSGKCNPAWGNVKTTRSNNLSHLQWGHIVHKYRRINICTAIWKYCVWLICGKSIQNIKQANIHK